MRGASHPDSGKNNGDFSRLPVLKKNRMPELHQSDPPFGGFLAVPVDKLKRIYVSPGPIYDPEGRKEDYWGLRKCLYNAGFRPGDIVMNTFSYHLTPAGIFLDEACNGIGCVTVPTGVGNTEIQVKTMAGLKINGYIGVPSFLMSLIKKMEELGYDTATRPCHGDRPGCGRDTVPFPAGKGSTTTASSYARHTSPPTWGGWPMNARRKTACTFPMICTSRSATR